MDFQPNRYASYKVYETVKTNQPLDEQHFSRVVHKWLIELNPNLLLLTLIHRGLVVLENIEENTSFLISFYAAFGITAFYKYNISQFLGFNNWDTVEKLADIYSFVRDTHLIVHVI